MSLLLLDIGNSRLKWVGVETLDAGLPPARAISHAGAPADALASLAAQWQGPRPQAVYVAHVTGQEHELALLQAVQSAFAFTPQFARSSAECAGLVSAYAEPARLGVDRWLAMLALWTRKPQAFAVASAGTALTFDAVSATGQHQGGVIAPGLATMVDATLGRTRFEVGAMAADFVPGLGRDTEACVRQGALHAAGGLLDRLAGQHAGPKVLAGGDAGLLHPHLVSDWQIEADLVLCGLLAWARLASAR